MRMNPAEVERRIVQITQAWERSCPEQSFAEMTLEQFKQAQQPCQDSKVKLAAAAAQWDVARRERDVACAKAVELMQWVVNSVKGNPKYGENSAVYSAMGYVPKSERSSGLTRRRESEAAKESAKAPNKEPEEVS